MGETTTVDRRKMAILCIGMFAVGFVLALISVHVWNNSIAGVDSGMVMGWFAAGFGWSRGWFSKQDGPSSEGEVEHVD